MPTKTTAAKTTARKTAAKRTPRKAAAPKVPTVEQLADAGLLVTNIRADLDAAVRERNALMAQAKAGGMRVADITRATGFASSGAAQNAIASGEAHLAG